MYQIEELSMHPWFEDVLKEKPLSSVLDSLTGVVSRAYMLDFIHALIDRGLEFTVGMIDLDNFKSYNDNYGHAVGDKVLSVIASNLASYVGSRGVVGRFGGDEFLVVSFIGNDYQRVHEFYENMFNQGNPYNQTYVFRRDLIIDHLKLYISATVGSASFPKDAQDYVTHFSLIDKTLYRGKFKGRNCYIIYVPQKHAHLEIPKMARHSLYDTFMEMAAGFDGGKDLQDRLHRTFDVMKKNIRTHFMFYVDGGRNVLDVEKNQVIGACEDLAPLITSEGYFACSARGELQNYPMLRDLMVPYVIHSLLVISIDPAKEKPCFLIVAPEPNTLHIWQDEEFAAAFVLARFVRELG